MANELVLDRSKSVRNKLRERLEFEGFTTEGADGDAAAAALCAKIPFDLILSDGGCHVPSDSDIPFIVLSDDGSIDAAVDALHHGASDYLTKPLDMNRLMRSIRAALDQGAAARSAAPRRVRRAKRGPADEIVGCSPAIEQVRALIERVAPTDARVLITGENGTGKELVARRLHAQSRRAGAPFVEVNCAAIPSELIESELFGHERGAFTSAVRQRRGRFEQADGGTLFMDEIGDMSPAAQAKVLRALQERRISRVGSDRDVEIDVRVIAATNKDLREEIARGRFREDLYHLIGVNVVPVPALPEHATDIPLLGDHFLRSIAGEYGTAPKEIDAEAVAALQRMRWTGNVRELRNAVERLIVLCDERITAGDVERYC